VNDDGPGIPKKEREKVFERFYRLHDRGVSGSGLGLSIVSEIAQMHQAKITVSGGENGVGTIIYVEFSEHCPE
jgi:two-component system sensor histidine kinase TctE